MPPTLPEDDSTLSDCGSFVTASSSLLEEHLPNSSSEVSPNQPGNGIILDWATTVVDMPSELEVSAGEIPEPSFNFSIPLPHALAVGQDSPLTAHVVEMADKASIQYDAIRNLLEIEHVGTLSDRHLSEYFCATIDLKNTVVLRRTAVLAELGRCAEYMAFLLRFTEKDDILVEDVNKRIDVIKQTSQDNNFDIGFWNLEYARSRLGGHSPRSFMEVYGDLYKEVVDSHIYDTAMNIALEFISDPTVLRDHRLGPVQRMPPASQ